MKHIMLTTVILISGFQIGLSQIKVNSSNGNVTVGSTANGAKELDVHGDAILRNESNSNAAALQFRDTDGNIMGFMQFDNPADHTTSNLNIEANHGNITIDAEEDLRFNTNDQFEMIIKKDGKIGMGTTAPTDLLHLNAGVNQGLTISRSGAATVKIRADIPGSIGTTSNHDFRFLTNNFVRTTIDVEGEFGIGITAPAEKLHVNGAIRIGSTSKTANGTIRYTGIDFEGRVGNTWTSLTQAGGGSSVWSTTGTTTFYNSGNVAIGTTSASQELAVAGDIGLTGEIVGISDARVKKNINPISNATDLVNALHPVSYEYKNDDFKSMGLPVGKQFGLIAQEVEKIIPEVVTEHSQNKDLNLKGINYQELIPLLTKAIQEQNKLIVQKQNQLDAQQKQLDVHQKQIDELRTLLK